MVSGGPNVGWRDSHTLREAYGGLLTMHFKVFSHVLIYS